MLAVGMFLIGSLALVQLAQAPEAFAQQTSTQTSAFGPSSPQVLNLQPTPKGGIPLGPPYGHPAIRFDEKVMAAASGVGVVAIGIGIWFYLYVTRRKRRMLRMPVR